MNYIQLQPPEPFNFKTPDDWPRWKRRFEQFRIASGLSEESQLKQVSTFLYCLGEEADAVLTSTNPSDEDRKGYDSVIGRFDGFFKVRKNIIFERARFNRRNQLEGETAETYIMELYTLAESCEFKDTKEEMIRDRLVVGIRDSSLSERMQMEPDLTLERAKKMVRQREAVYEQQEILKGASDVKSLEEVQTTRGPQKGRGKKMPMAKPKPKVRHTTSQPKNCGRCGKGQHQQDQCPARDVECHRCHKKGHYSSLCYSKSVSEIASSEECLDTAFLNTLQKGKESCWRAKIQLCGKETMFKLDTGAEVTAVSEKTYQQLKNQHLIPPQKVLYGPSQTPLKVLGQFEAQLCHRKASVRQQVFVVQGLKSDLLGLPAITALNLAVQVDATTRDTELKQKFQAVFHGLGNLGEAYEIKSKPDAKPRALFAPRRVSLPLRNKVLEELNRMESIGVISKVSEPTAWCAGMVVVPKQNGNLRICVDLKPLNENVLSEVHPLPKVDETLAQLAGAKIFSKLDANSGIWQIPLAKKSRLLTTFVIPYSRYCFNKLPFGICSAPEHFQRRMSEVLAGLEGVLCLMDDVLVFGKSAEEHDTRLLAVLQRIQQAGVTLNPDKCEFNKTSLIFLGHLLDHRGVQADPQKTSAILKMDPPTSVAELRRFMGMANQLGNFSRNLAELTQPLRELLSKKRAWQWGPQQDQAFAKVKEELAKPTVLALYDPAAETKISADASSYGLGAVLMQKEDTQWKPVAYASRSMSETEQRYAQIEKEGLAVTWACEKFASYILGKRISIETDHKPLVPLLGTKDLDNLPPRVLRFCLRLARFDYTISHVPGKALYAADTLSRAPLESSETDSSPQGEAELLLEMCLSNLPANKEWLD